VTCDLDPRMLAVAERRVMGASVPIRFINCGFHEVAEHLRPEERPLSGWLADLGLNTLQLAGTGGFAFKTDSPRDMRFDPRQSLTAAVVINQYPLDELRAIFRKYGQLAQADALARAIVKARKKAALESTAQLREILAPFFPAHHLYKGLANAGQALRIVVNRELENLRIGLSSLTRLLKSGGRFVVISYHSLEDRIVKNFIRSHSRESGYPPELQERLDHREFRLRSLTSGAVVPTQSEVKRNPSARSARLRAAVKV